MPFYFEEILDRAEAAKASAQGQDSARAFLADAGQAPQVVRRGRFEDYGVVFGSRDVRGRRGLGG
jgi:hypothetical protein